MARIAGSYDGKAFVCTDGPTLLMYPLEMDRDPWWLRDVGRPIVGVGMDESSVAAVGADGEISRWRIADGEPIGRVATGFPTRATATDGDTIVLVGGAVRVVSASDPGKSLDIPVRAAAAGLSPDRIALAGEDGWFRLYDRHGVPRGEVDVGVPLRGVAVRPDGTWTVTGGERVYSIDRALGVSVITKATGYAPSNVSWCPLGHLLAIQLDDSLMIVMRLPSKDTAIQLRYPERRIVDVAIPGWPYTLVGLDLGDGNWAQMDHALLLRTDPLPERTRNSWTVSVSIDERQCAPDGPPATQPSPGPVSPPPAPAGDSLTQALVAIFAAIGVLLALGLALSRCR